jgi:Txe/YoeB family toxin of Txe-Axe toxin-antitoxin module
MEVNIKMNNENDIDVTILINTYSQKISSLSIENIVLESKIQSLIKDFEKEKFDLLEKIKELQTDSTDKY